MLNVSAFRTAQHSQPKGALIVCSTSATNSSLRFNLKSTFDIVAGKAPLQERFIVHTNMMIHRSEFFRTARSSQWLADPAKPVDLEPDDPEIVSGYLSCVYFGVDALKADIEDQTPKGYSVVGSSEQNVLEDAFAWSQVECEKRWADTETEGSPYTIACELHFLLLAKIYLHADKLRDPKTANLVIDEFIRFSPTTLRNPDALSTNHVYESTVQGSPLRKLMRDYIVHETKSDGHLDSHAINFHEDFCRDVLVEFLRAKDGDPVEPSKCEQENGIAEKMCADRCHYHLHDSLCVRCVPELSAGTCACAKS
jgi:hypothetical protein